MSNGKPSRMSLPSDNPSAAWSMIKAQQNKSAIRLLEPAAPRQEHCVRIVAISDTHGRHDRVSIPDCDVLIHSGDFTFYGNNREDAEDFDNYLGNLPNCKKILIAGNHDFYMHKINNKKPYSFKNCEYLQDSSTHVFGYKIYGTPWIPHFHNGAFMLKRGNELLEKWKLIPDDTDILVTHGPPLGYGDTCRSNYHAGDVDLLLEIQARIKPMIHLFGHIHEDHGSWTDGTTTYINSSICDVHYRPVNDPIAFDLPRKI